MQDNKYTFLFFGRSGCGKGTQAKLLREFLENNGKKVVYIETGQGLRDFTSQKRGNYVADKVSTTIMGGVFLPPFMPIWIWTSALIDRFTGKEDVILDGLARHILEATILDGALRYLEMKNIFVIEMDVSDDWSKERMLARHRSDDAEEEIKRRLDAFETSVRPVLEFFEKEQGYNYLKINGMQPIEAVHNEILEKLGLK